MSWQEYYDQLQRQSQAKALAGHFGFVDKSFVSERVGQVMVHKDMNEQEKQAAVVQQINRDQAKVIIDLNELVQKQSQKLRELQSTLEVTTKKNDGLITERNNANQEAYKAKQEAATEREKTKYAYQSQRPGHFGGIAPGAESPANRHHYESIIADKNTQITALERELNQVRMFGVRAMVEAQPTLARESRENVLKRQLESAEAELRELKARITGRCVKHDALEADIKKVTFDYESHKKRSAENYAAQLKTIVELRRSLPNLTAYGNSNSENVESYARLNTKLVETVNKLRNAIDQVIRLPEVRILYQASNILHTALAEYK